MKKLINIILEFFKGFSRGFRQETIVKPSLKKKADKFKTALQIYAQYRHIRSRRNERCRFATTKGFSNL